METIELTATEIVPEKKKLKICVYGISKNEEMFIKRWADSAWEADLVLLADTGSDDDTVKIAKENGVQVHHIHIKPWRFDTARNASMVLIPSDFDVCISLDVDEVLEPGWREEIERLWQPNTTRLRYLFTWGPGKTFYHVKIHSRHGHYWRHLVHEIPVTDSRTPEVFAYSDKILITHHPDASKSRGQYYDMLEACVLEDPYCCRNAFYWARENFYYGKWEKAIELLQKYLDMPSATWDAERSYAYVTMGKCYEALGNAREAEKAFYKGAFEAPHAREGWVSLSDLCYKHGRWPESYAFAKRAIDITHQQNVYTEDPACWSWRPWDFAAISAFRLGIKEEAIKYGEKALEYAPEDERLANNLKWYKGEIA